MQMLEVEVAWVRHGIMMADRVRKLIPSKIMYPVPSI
uniref:Uncharacterized protein n=1 Tax=Rhizophora mucronata TaxID=61149 RepID=A0A2P2J0Z9_RHIMU